MRESLKNHTADSGFALCWLPVQVRLSVGFVKMNKMSSLVSGREMIGQAISISSFGHNKRASANFAHTDLMGVL